MIPLRVAPLGEKHIRITGLNPVVLDCLHAIPEILERRDTPEARRRLLPDPTPADAAANDEWQQMVAPELRHLFVTAGETMLQNRTGNCSG